MNPGQGLELNITNQFETYFIADFNVTNFSNDYGDITHFAIWVREIDDQENIENLPTKPGKTPKRWSSVRFKLYCGHFYDKMWFINYRPAPEFS